MGRVVVLKLKHADLLFVLHCPVSMKILWFLISTHLTHRARGDISKIAKSLDLGAPVAGNFFFAENK